MKWTIPRRWTGALAALLVLALVPAARAQTTADCRVLHEPAALVDAALGDTTAALAPPVDAAARTARLRAVMACYFDVAALGRNSLGAAWRLVPSSQQVDFLATFENFLAATYLEPLGRADDLRFGPAHAIAPLGGHDADGPVMVRVDVWSTGEPPHPVLIAVAARDDGSYRIVDVSAESVSLGRLLAADFGAFLRRNGGRLEALVAALHQKIAVAVKAP